MCDDGIEAVVSMSPGYQPLYWSSIGVEFRHMIPMSGGLEPLWEFETLVVA